MGLDIAAANADAANEVEGAREKHRTAEAIGMPYRDARRRWNNRYSCQINPVTMTSKTVKTMRPNPCVY
jgi:hypothetical protein